MPIYFPFLVGLSIVVVWVSTAFCLTFTTRKKLTWAERIKGTQELFLFVPAALGLLAFVGGFAFAILSIIGSLAIMLWSAIF